MPEGEPRCDAVVTRASDGSVDETPDQGRKRKREQKQLASLEPAKQVHGSNPAGRCDPHVRVLRAPVPAWVPARVCQCASVRVRVRACVRVRVRACVCVCVCV